MTEEGLKVLMISTDRNILVTGSDVSERIKEYGGLVEELHIVLLSDVDHGLVERSLSNNVWVYPTGSSSKYLRSIDAAKKGKELVLEKKFVRGKSLITTQDPFECGWAGLKIKNKWRLPLEVQLHTDPFSPNFSGTLNWFRKRVAKKVLKKADSIRVVSEFLKSRISNLTQAPISALPIFVEKEKIERGEVKFDVHARYPWHFIILMVCRLEEEKNLPLALEILSRVREKYKDAGLLIVGSGSKEDELKSLVNKIGLNGAVEFAGWQTDLTSFYRTSNIFLQTSSYEGYGLALVEAGLNGLPVVTTPVGLAQELVHGKDAYIYPHTNLGLFVEGILDLIEHTEKRENLRLNLKNTLENRLMSKEVFLEKMRENWEAVSTKIQ